MALTKSQHGCSDQPKAVHNYWRICGILRKDGPGSIIPHKARCESLVTRTVGDLSLIPLEANLSDFQVQLVARTPLLIQSHTPRSAKDRMYDDCCIHVD